MERLPDPVSRDILRALGPAVTGPQRNLAPLHVALEPRQAVCPQHGEYTSTGTRFTTGRGREVWTPCQACVEQRKEEEREAAELERQRRAAAHIEAMVGRAAIPGRFIGRGFDNYRAETPEQVHALTTLRDYAERFGEHLRTGESLLLLGRTGTGKSHLAGAALQAIMPAHCGMYTTAADLIEMVRETWGRGAERSQAQVLATLAAVPLLVIDEIGVQYGTESEQNILFQVLDRRYRDHRPVILMGNLTPKEAEALLGDRIYDRLRETATTVLFAWDSYRRSARKEAL